MRIGRSLVNYTIDRIADRSVGLRNRSRERAIVINHVIRVRVLRLDRDTADPADDTDEGMSSLRRSRSIGRVIVVSKLKRVQTSSGPECVRSLASTRLQSLR